MGNDYSLHQSLSLVLDDIVTLREGWVDDGYTFQQNAKPMIGTQSLPHSPEVLLDRSSNEPGLGGSIPGNKGPEVTHTDINLAAN